MTFLGKMVSSLSSSQRTTNAAGPSRPQPTVETPPPALVGAAANEKEGEKKEVAPLTYDQAHLAFWVGLEGGNVNAVSASLAALSAPERRRLAQQPKHGAFETKPKPEPQRPLCIAAYQGSMDMCLALLERPGAYARVGDELDKSRPLTSLFWATFAGHKEIMDYLHDSQGLDARDALLAVEQNASKDNIEWLVKRGLRANSFFDSAFKAVKQQHEQNIRAFIRYGKVDCNQILAKEDDLTGSKRDLSDIYDNHQSILCWAIRNGKLGSAQVLVDEGAGVNGEIGIQKLLPSLDGSPVVLTMQRYANNSGEPQSFALLAKLLRLGAEVDTETLKRAMGHGKPYSTQLFKTLLMQGNAAPKTQKEAFSLLNIAKSNQLSSVQMILVELTLMLQQQISWQESEKKSKDPEFHFVQLARERVLEFVEMTDDEIDPALLAADDHLGSDTVTKGEQYLSLSRRPKQSTVGRMFGDRIGIGSESRSQTSTTGALAKVKKKQGMFS